MVKVEMYVQVCVNGRPLWRMAKPVRKELSFQMTDKEYAQIVDAASNELSQQVKQARARADEAEKKKAVAK